MTKQPVTPKAPELGPLVTELRGLIHSARHSAATTVNTLQVLTNFEIGRRIVEHEQKGEKRAEYGKELLKVLSDRLTDEFGRGFSRANLEYMRRFYLEWQHRYPRISQTASEIFQVDEIWQKPSVNSSQGSIKAETAGLGARAGEGTRQVMTIQTNPAWRLIDTPSLSGVENMAIDEALLRSFDPSSSLPVLRLYGWNPPALSLGRFQKAAEVLDLERCHADGVAVVRRVTGGGVIYHADELTYSLVCAPEQIPAAISIKDSFRVLSGFLLAYYRSLGLDSAYATDVVTEGTRLGERTAFCFAGKESFDILINGFKIGGNAQRRLKGVIFQHGSIPLQNRAMTGLTYMREQSPEYAEGSASLAEYGVSADRNSLLQGLARSFSGYFGVELKNDILSDSEQADMNELLSNKYSTEQWNLEGVGQ